MRSAFRSARSPAPAPFRVVSRCGLFCGLRTRSQTMIRLGRGGEKRSNAKLGAPLRLVCSVRARHVVPWLSGDPDADDAREKYRLFIGENGTPGKRLTIIVARGGRHTAADEGL